jgi:hypothetical protein
MKRDSQLIEELDRRFIEVLHGTSHFRIQEEHEGPPVAKVKESSTLCQE